MNPLALKFIAAGSDAQTNFVWGLRAPEVGSTAGDLVGVQKAILTTLETETMMTTETETTSVSYAVIFAQTRTPALTPNPTMTQAAPLTRHAVVSTT